ncbi:MAG: DUF63 family protein [Methanothrix sp.]|nr:DUF63 family protein [Methanothrix sp.]
MSDSLGLAAFVQKYYIDPIIYDTSYNPVDTITWAIILGLSIIGLLKLLGRLKISMDERLLLSTLPYILAGSSLRVIEDANLVAAPWRYLLITPLIFFLVFFVTAAILIMTRRIWGEQYHKKYAAIGFLWTGGNLAVLSTVGLVNSWVIVAVFLLGTAFAGGVILCGRRLSVRSLPALKFLDGRDSQMIIYAHMLDASSTFIGVDWFDYYEKHVVPTFFINLAGTAAIMYPLKLLVLLPVLYMIDRSMQEPSMRNLTRLALITLGLAPAVRNTLRLALGV